MISAMTDHELLRHYVQERNQGAFTELVRRYIDLVYSTALRRTGQTQLAEDVTQNVFFLLSQKAPKIS